MEEEVGTVMVTEYDTRRPELFIDGDEWWVVLRAVDGTEVLIPGDLIADEQPGVVRPDRCEYVAVDGTSGCHSLAADPGWYCTFHRDLDTRRNG